MKKLFKINFPLLIAALLIVACESDGDNDPVAPVNVPPVAVDLSMAMDMSEGNSKTISLMVLDNAYGMMEAYFEVNSIEAFDKVLVNSSKTKNTTL